MPINNASAQVFLSASSQGEFPCSLFKILVPVFIASQLPRDLGRVVGRPRWRNTFLIDSLSSAAKNGNDAVLKSFHSERTGKRDAVGRRFLWAFHEWFLAFLAVSFIKFSCVRELRHRKYDELERLPQTSLWKKRRCEEQPRTSMEFNSSP